MFIKKASDNQFDFVLTNVPKTTLRELGFARSRNWTHQEFGISVTRGTIQRTAGTTGGAPILTLNQIYEQSTWHRTET